MFSKPPTGNMEGSLQNPLKFETSSATLDAFFIALYGISSKRLERFYFSKELFEDFLTFIDKWDATSVQSAFCDILASHRLLLEGLVPVTSYFIGCRYGNEELICMLLSDTLRTPIQDVTHIPEMLKATAADYQRMIDLHKTKLDAALKILQQLTTRPSSVHSDALWYQDDWQPDGWGGRECNGTRRHTKAEWIAKFVNRASNQFRTKFCRATVDSVFLPHFFVGYYADQLGSCHSCAGVMRTPTFSQQLALLQSELTTLMTKY